MTKIKLCGMSRMEDIETVNRLLPEYIGFIFVPSRRRYIPPERAAELKHRLVPRIAAVGVFIDERPEYVAKLLGKGVIDAAQLHGGEDETYIRSLRSLTDKQVIKAFRIETENDIEKAMRSTADFILLDSGGGGTGTAFDWKLAERAAAFPRFRQSCFLAGGLNRENVRRAAERFCPYAVDVSSGIETDGRKDPEKMAAFVREARGACGKD